MGVSRSSKIVSRVTSDKTKVLVSLEKEEHVCFLFFYIHLSEKGHMFTCFLREAKVGVSEIKKIYVSNKTSGPVS